MKKLQDTPNPDDHLAKAKNAILTLKRKQTSAFLSLAKAVVDLRNRADKDLSLDLEAWLRTEVGFSTADATMLASFDEQLAEEAVLTRRRVSPDVVAALSMITDARIRDVCLARIRLGDALDVASIQELAEQETMDGMSADELAGFRRAELFAAAAARLGSEAVVRLEAGAAELLTIMDMTRIDPIRVHLGEPARPQVSAARTPNTLAEKAADVLRDLDTLIAHVRPSSEYWRTAENAVSWSSVRWARQALIDLGRDDFRPHELLLEGNSPVVHRWCLEFLAGRRSSCVTDHTASGGLTRIFSRPTFVDIDAGVGGSALGLMAAGMSPILVAPRSFKCYMAIKKNEIFTDEQLRQVRTDFQEQLRSLKKQDVHVVTSGIPWHQYEENDRERAFENAVTAVDVLRPRVFFFEALPKTTGEDKVMACCRFHGHRVKMFLLKPESMNAKTNIQPRV